MAKKRSIRKKTPKELADPAFRRRSKQQADMNKKVFSYCKRVPKKRAAFLMDIAAETWVHRFDSDGDEKAFQKEVRRWERLRNQFLRDATNPLELHFFAAHYNCDIGSRALHKIVAHPKCDAGTALWKYWVNDPYFYQEYKSLSDCPNDPDQREWLRLLRTIERRFRRNDFATSKIPFDPTPWSTEPRPGWLIEPVAHKIPDVMSRPITARGQQRA